MSDRCISIILLRIKWWIMNRDILNRQRLFRSCSAFTRAIVVTCAQQMTIQNVESSDTAPQ